MGLFLRVNNYAMVNGRKAYIYVKTCMLVHLNILCIVCINLYYTSAECLLKRHKHFIQSVMVSVAVSKLGKTDLVPVQPRAKMNSACLLL